jgi:Acetamidase/Formamidase family
MKTISIDRGKALAQEPRTGHNRWHPDIEPIVEVGEGDDVALETRDACDGHLTSRSTVADLATLPVGAIHPLTGPVSVKGARPGDLLEVEFREITPQPWGFSAIIPGLGYLRDLMTTPFLETRWRSALNLRPLETGLRGGRGQRWHGHCSLPCMWAYLTIGGLRRWGRTSRKDGRPRNPVVTELGSASR